MTNNIPKPIDGAIRDNSITIDGALTYDALRNPVEQKTAEKLIPLLRRYLIEKYGKAEIYISQAKMSKGESLPMGDYRKNKDHIIDVIIFTHGAMKRSIDTDAVALSNIARLTEYFKEKDGA